MIPLQMEKTLSRKPNPPMLHDPMSLRTFCEFPQVDDWLMLRRDSFAGQIQAARDWRALDFHREFTNKIHWDPDNLGFLFHEVKIVGSIYLELDSPQNVGQATLNWLMVMPEFRRQGLGRILIAWAEHKAWEQGSDLLCLTTLPTWKSAIRCYRSCGFHAVC